MNYRHLFHAGGFVDVVKHVVLTVLAHSFLRKDTPFCYLDTHAGIGLYDLSSTAAQKSKEYENGIAKILQAQNPPEFIKKYIDIVKQINKNENLHFYPGSPEIVNHILRPIDRMQLCELHPEDYQTLKKHFFRDKKAAVHHLDAYLALKSLLPPKEKRGLILIDPPYENVNEYQHIIESLPQALKRFETGVYAIWYPIKDRAPVERFQQQLKEKIARPMLVCELSIYPENLPTHLNGCGMLIINPPFQVDLQLKEIFPWLWETLSVNRQGKYSIFSLLPERFSLWEKGRG